MNKRVVLQLYQTLTLVNANMMFFFSSFKLAYVHLQSCGAVIPLTLVSRSLQGGTTESLYHGLPKGTVSHSMKLLDLQRIPS
jgi:hypothetical protein